MSEVTTAYKVRLFFQVDRSRATLSFLDELGKKTKGAASNAKGLTEQLKGLAAAAGVTGGLMAAKSAFVDFNAEMEGAKIGMASILQMKLGGYFDDASKHANKLVGDFQQIAKASVGTTKDFTTFASAIMAPVMMTNAHLGTTEKRLAQLRTLTKGGVIAATVLGEDPELASRDVDQWLMGRLSTVDRVAKKLLGPMGLTTDQVNKMSSEKRLALLEKALTQPAIIEATKAYEKSWLGVKSTMMDTLQMLAGKIGLPLFKAITKEVASWSAWMDKHPEKVEAFATTVSKLLVDAFGTAKDVFGFIVQHKDLLLTLAKAVLISKGVGMVGGLVASPLRGISSLAERFGGLGAAAEAASGKTLSFAEKMAKGANQLQGAIGLLGAVYVGASAIADLVSKKQDRDIAAKKEVWAAKMWLGVGGQRGALDRMTATRMAVAAKAGKPITEDQARRESATKVLNEAKDAGLIDATGKIDIRKIGQLRGDSTRVYGANAVTDFASAYTAMKKGKFYNTPIEGFDPSTHKAAQKGANAGGWMPQGDVKFDDWFRKTYAQELDFLKRLEDTMAVDRARLGAEFDKLLAGLSFFDMLNPLKLMQAAMGDMKGTKDGRLKQPTPKKGDVNVNIRKVEVVADDPDRVVLGILSAAEDAVRNPSTASGSFRDR